MPTLWRVAVRGIDAAQVRPEQLHGAMCRLLDPASSTGADAHKATRKGWAVAPLAGDAQAVEMTIGTLSEECEDAFMSRCRLGEPVIFGEQQGFVVAEPMVVQRETWDELSQPTGARKWRITTLSPSALASGRRYSPLLVPSSIVGSLSRQWEALSDVRIPRLTGPQNADLWVSSMRGSTVVTVVRHDKSPGAKPKVIPGFMGSLTVEAVNESIARIADVLLRFGQYAGVGVCTTHGLGAVRIVPSVPKVHSAASVPNSRRSEAPLVPPSTEYGGSALPQVPHLVLKV